MMRLKYAVPLLATIAAITLFPASALAHCDTLSGPVVSAARVALDQRNITPILKWVKPDAEPELRDAFAKTLAVRATGADARELADRYFFETLVRLHRAGEGAPYTGLKSDDPDEAILLADRALQTGNVDEIVRPIAEHVATALRQRFEHVVAAKKHADDNVTAGRAFVEAYVEYTHFVESVAGLGGADHKPAHTEK